MIQEAETETGLIEVVSLDIQFFDGIVHVVSETNVQGTGPTTLVFIGWNVAPKCLEVAETVAGYRDRC